jgi:Icc protein
LGITHADTSQPLKLVQITDCHLGENTGDDLLGMDTDDSLQQVLALVKSEQGIADLLLATGDISNHGHKGSYTRFRDATTALARHVRWLPGNHDNQSLMRQAVAGGPELSRTIDIAQWRVIMLDSTVAGEVGGRFSARELAFLEQSLLDSPAAHVLICMHHHPVPVGCNWLDEQRVANADEFFAVVDQFESVRGILWGHIHQQIDIDRGGVKLMSTPSSCVQFAQNSPVFKLDKLNPGYRSLLLYPDGRIDTKVSRVTAVDFAINYDAAQGY